MPNITITNVDTGSVALELFGAADGILNNAGADPVTYAAGTILARSTADGEFYPYDPAGLDGLDVASAILTYAVEVAGTGSTPVRVLTAGKVIANRLAIHDGTEITSAHLDALRNFSIIPIDVTDLGATDNPQG